MKGHRQAGEKRAFETERETMTAKKWLLQTEQTIHMPVSKALELVSKLEWDGNLDTIAGELIAAACALAKVVDKLPKDADGDPIEDGRNYFFPCANGALKFAAYFGPQPESLTPYPWIEGHKTKAAAQAALKKAEP